MSRRERPQRSKALEAEARIRGGGRSDEKPELTEIQDLILRATAEATPGLRDLAREAKISGSTLSSWRRGTRVPPPEAIEVLADVLEDRAKVLDYYAHRLQEAAKV